MSKRRPFVVRIKCDVMGRDVDYTTDVRVEAESHYDAAQAVGDLLSRLLCPKCTPPFTAGCDVYQIYEHTCGMTE